MATPKRKALSKRVRFEVFKRDSFECQYCGAHPPGVILHVDHLIAVANGGSNDIDNLITSCEPCNSGKGARSLSATPATVKEKAAMLAESEAQLLGYQALQQSRFDRVESEAWRVLNLIEDGAGKNGVDKQWFLGTKRFIERLGFFAVVDAAELARSKFPRGGNRTFKYFCGCCWGMIRGQESEA